jgi:hypothetical protein
VAQKKKELRNEVPKEPVKDNFQSVADARIENLSKKLEGKGRPILYGLLALIGIAVLGGIIYSWMQRSSAQAQTALGRAIGISTAQVSASPLPNNTDITFKTEKERSEKAIPAFEEVASKYGSPFKEKAQYFIAVNRLKVDREAGIRELEGLTSNSNREVASLAKFALAEARFADGKFDDAARLYSELAGQNSNVLAADTIQFSLASVYEKQGKKQEAADIYFNLAKQGREAKDPEGKPVTLSSTAREAATKLEKLDAARYAQLPPEPTTLDL